MGSQNDREILNRIENLERVIRAMNDLLIDLAERVGDSISKQVFTVAELAIRWNCSERHVRNIIKQRHLPLLRGARGEIRKPISLIKSEVLKYENSISPSKNIPQYRRCLPANANILPSTGKTMRGVNPFVEKVQKSEAVVKGVRKLGE